MKHRILITIDESLLIRFRNYTKDKNTKVSTKISELINDHLNMRRL